MKADDAVGDAVDPETAAGAERMEGLLHFYGMPGFLVRRAKQMSTAIFAERCGALGMTPPQYAVLRILQALPDLDQGELADYAVLDEATIGGILDRLQKRNLIHRRRSGRRRLAYLTDTGRGLLAALEPAVAQAQADLLSPLNERERRQLKRLLSKMTGTANEHHRPRRTRARTRRLGGAAEGSEDRVTR